jgi:GR25 family glycosyltransferase involved in LPS biosynthesis
MQKKNGEYLQRMEKAVVQANAAMKKLRDQVEKLKAENETLRNENGLLQQRLSRIETSSSTYSSSSATLQVSSCSVGSTAPSSSSKPLIASKTNKIETHISDKSMVKIDREKPIADDFLLRLEGPSSTANINSNTKAPPKISSKVSNASQPIIQFLSPRRVKPSEVQDNSPVSPLPAVPTTTSKILDNHQSLPESSSASILESVASVYTPPEISSLPVIESEADDIAESLLPAPSSNIKSSAAIFEEISAEKSCVNGFNLLLKNLQRTHLNEFSSIMDRFPIEVLCKLSIKHIETFLSKFQLDELLRHVIEVQSTSSVDDILSVSKSSTMLRIESIFPALVLEDLSVLTELYLSAAKSMANGYHWISTIVRDLSMRIQAKCITSAFSPKSMISSMAMDDHLDSLDNDDDVLDEAEPRHQTATEGSQIYISKLEYFFHGYHLPTLPSISRELTGDEQVRLQESMFNDSDDSDTSSLCAPIRVRQHARRVDKIVLQQALNVHFLLSLVEGMKLYSQGYEFIKNLLIICPIASQQLVGKDLLLGPMIGILAHLRQNLDMYYGWKEEMSLLLRLQCTSTSSSTLIDSTTQIGTEQLRAIADEQIGTTLNQSISSICDGCSSHGRYSQRLQQFLSSIARFDDSDATLSIVPAAINFLSSNNLSEQQIGRLYIIYTFRQLGFFSAAAYVHSMLSNEMDLGEIMMGQLQRLIRYGNCKSTLATLHEEWIQLKSCMQTTFKSASLTSSSKDQVQHAFDSASYSSTQLALAVQLLGCLLDAFLLPGDYERYELAGWRMVDTSPQAMTIVNRIETKLQQSTNLLIVAATNSLTADYDFLSHGSLQNRIDLLTRVLRVCQSPGDVSVAEKHQFFYYSCFMLLEHFLFFSQSFLQSILRQKCLSNEVKIHANKTLSSLPFPWSMTLGDRLNYRHFQTNQMRLLRYIDMIPVFVVNLPRRIDRWYHFHAIAQHQDLYPIRLKAFDAQCEDDMQAVTENDVTRRWDSTLNHTFDDCCLPLANNEMTVSERACAASHLHIWRSIASPTSALQTYFHFFNYFRMFDWHLILEDDAMVPNTRNIPTMLSIRQKIFQILHSVPKDCDILYLGYQLPPRTRVAALNLFTKVSYVWSCHAYAVKKSTIDILLSNLPIDAPVDSYLARLIHDHNLNVSANLVASIDS